MVIPDVDATSAVSDLVITGYTLNGGEKININNGDSITDNIYKKDNVNITSIRLFVKWDDGSSNKMDNEANTNATLSGEKAKLKLAINFIQIPN